MAVLSRNHHARHLSSEAEQAAFDRTAPIMTAQYWDLADQLRRPDRDPEAIADAELAMLGDLATQAHTHTDAVQLGRTKEIVRTEIDLVINN